MLTRDNEDVCICGIGARTPLGLDAPSLLPLRFGAGISASSNPSGLCR